MADFADLNGAHVFEGIVSIPSYGIWSADVKLVNAPPLPTTPGALALTIADLVLVGTLLRSDTYGAAISARILGGFAGWRKRLTSRSYNSPTGVTYAMVIGDAAIEIGESVTGAPSGVLGQRWARAGDVAGLLLSYLVSQWYMAPGGVTTIGVRPSTQITSKFQVIDYEPQKHRVSVAADSIADFAPGRTFTAPTLPAPAPISLVEHHLGGTVRTELLLV